jgi:hypothetical protein
MHPEEGREIRVFLSHHRDRDRIEDRKNDRQTDMETDRQDR